MVNIETILAQFENDCSNPKKEPVILELSKIVLN